MNHNILVTGGAGFIGSHVVRLFVNKYPTYNIYNLDIISYSANINYLKDIEHRDNYKFIKGDICDSKLLKTIFKKYKISSVINLAAETHVDRSILDPFIFAKTNVMGTLSLLNVSKECWKGSYSGKLFYQISTDEVYGSTENGKFLESSRFSPNSPYAASKASADHFVNSFGTTYGIPTMISNCSNNYGPCQYPEKLIPLFVKNILDNKSLPVYGNGNNIRDWLHVEDHANAIDLIFHKGNLGETYNIGGDNEYKNIDLINLIIKYTDKLLERKKGSSDNLISFVEDRKGHDYRYAINSTKIKNKLGWKPKIKFQNGLKKTIFWYIQNLK